MPDLSPLRGTLYALWHIPSSTLLVTSNYRDEIARRLRGALDDGVSVEDLMLQVTGANELIGHQLLGASIVDAIAGPDVRPDPAPGTA